MTGYPGLTWGTNGKMTWCITLNMIDQFSVYGGKIDGNKYLEDRDISDGWKDLDISHAKIKDKDVKVRWTQPKTKKVEMLRPIDEDISITHEHGADGITVEEGEVMKDGSRVAV